MRYLTLTHNGLSAQPSIYEITALNIIPSVAIVSAHLPSSMLLPSSVMLQRLRV